MYLAVYNDGNKKNKDRVSENLKELVDWLVPLIGETFVSRMDPKASIYDLDEEDDKREIITFYDDSMGNHGILEAERWFDFTKLNDSGIKFTVDEDYDTAVIHTW